MVGDAEKGEGDGEKGRRGRVGGTKRKGRGHRGERVGDAEKRMVMEKKGGGT